MQPGYYSSPIYGTFDARLDACWEDNCTDLVLSDLSHWSTETYNNITSVTINVTYTGTSYTTGTDTVTTDFISAALTGTITTDGTTAVVGVGTAFESELSVGDSILVDGTNEIITIESITDDTNLTLVSWATASAGDTFYKANMQTTLVPTDLGMTSTAFPDGEYTIVYTIVVNGTTYTATRSGYNICTVSCCINEKIATIPDLYDCNNCAHPEINNILTYKGLLEALKYAVKCGDTTRADNILTTLQAICNSTNCACS